MNGVGDLEIKCIWPRDMALRFLPYPFLTVQLKKNDMIIVKWCAFVIFNLKWANK